MSIKILKVQALANKQYISIIRLFNHCGISTGEDFNLTRAKKHLDAEFRIAPGGFIEADGYTYTRHDVFEEIERPDFSNRLVFHRQIWKSPHLLQLLEKNNADLGWVEAEFILFWNNKQFDEFFSPYFLGPFNHLSRTLLAERKLKEMSDLLRYEDFLQPADREEAFRPLRVFLDENIRLLRNINGENYTIMRPKISHWIFTDWHLFFNNLPHEFYDEKNDITTRLINLGVAIQKSHRRDCRRMSEQLISLNDTPENIRRTIISNHSAYTGPRAGAISWRSGWWILWVIFMLIRVVSSDGCGESKTDFKPSSIQYEYNGKSMPLDSMVKILKDSNVKVKYDRMVH